MSICKLQVVIFFVLVLTMFKSFTVFAAEDLSFVEQWVGKASYEVIGGTELVENKIFKKKFESIDRAIANEFYRRVAHPTKLLVDYVKKEGKFIRISFDDFYGDAFSMRFYIDPIADEMNVCWRDDTKSTDNTVFVRNDGEKIRVHGTCDLENIESIISGNYTDNYIKQIKTLVGKWSSSFVYNDKKGEKIKVEEIFSISAKNPDRDNFEEQKTLLNKNLHFFCSNKNTRNSKYKGTGFIIPSIDNELTLELKLLPHQQCGDKKLIRRYKSEGDRLYILVDGKKVFYSKK